MRYNKKVLLFVICSLVTTTFGYRESTEAMQASDFVLEPVNHDIRLAHAQELLGAEFHQSPHFKGKNGLKISRYILNQVRSRLPEDYKSMAPTVAQILIRESERNHLDPVFVLALIETESKFNPLARGRHGEIGLMQVKPSTAAWLAEKYKLKFNGEKSLMNPIQNIRFGIAYIRFLRGTFESTAQNYVSAYNVGPARLRKLHSEEVIPVEYSTRVMTAYHRFYEEI